MLVLAAPHGDDPRDDGYNHAIPGELLRRPPVCDSGQAAACGCERSWIGVGSGKATTLAQVVYKVGLTRGEYLGTIGLHLLDTGAYSAREALAEGVELADTAEYVGSGAYITIDIDPDNPDNHMIEALEMDHG
ncbi:hypothetical protein ACGFI3_42810 [Nonomuraea wenchangensis]|uniref:DUF7715 family protein n=1 Tax=Nonomuraea wenchangensis TaxID=568860 RepID=UPI0037131DE6